MQSDFDVLKNWMFGSLASLLDDKSPNPNLKILKMSIGEPQLGPPYFIRDKLMNFLRVGQISANKPIPSLKMLSKLI